MKDKLLLIRNQLKMGHRLSFAEAMLLQRAIDILVYGAGNASAQSPIDHGYRPECECSGCKATARICTELAGNSPAIPDGWISCSERMPEDEQEVIVHNKLGYRYVSYFDEHSGLFFDMRGGNQMNCIEHIFVTHWMPAPAAPKPDQN